MDTAPRLHRDLTHRAPSGRPQTMAWPRSVARELSRGLYQAREERSALGTATRPVRTGQCGQAGGGGGTQTRHAPLLSRPPKPAAILGQSTRSPRRRVAPQPSTLAARTEHERPQGPAERLSAPRAVPSHRHLPAQREGERSAAHLHNSGALSIHTRLTHGAAGSGRRRRVASDHAHGRRRRLGLEGVRVHAQAGNVVVLLAVRFAWHVMGSGFDSSYR